MKYIWSINSVSQSWGRGGKGVSIISLLYHNSKHYKRELHNLYYNTKIYYDNINYMWDEGGYGRSDIYLTISYGDRIGWG